MKKRLFSIPLALAITVAATAQSKWEWVVEPKYDRIGVGMGKETVDGIFVAWLADDKPGYIEIATGKWYELPYKTDYYYNYMGNGMFSNGRILTDKTGKELFDPDIFNIVEFFAEGLFFVNEKGTNKRGIIDQTGTWVLENVELLGQMHEGLVAAQKSGENLYGFIDATGKWAIQPQFEQSWGQQPDNFSEGLCVIKQFEMKGNIQKAKYGFIDKSGRRVIPFQFEDASSFSGGLAIAKSSDGKYGYIDPSGNWAIPPRYKYVKPFSEGLAIAESADGKYGFINPSGDWVIPPRYNYATPFSEGLAAVSNADDKWGYIDSLGNWVIPPRYSSAGPFSEGLAVMHYDEKVCYMDKSTKVIYSRAWYANLSHHGAELSAFENGFGTLKIPKATSTGINAAGQSTYSSVDKYDISYIDKNGKIIETKELEYIQLMPNGYFKAKKNGKWGIARYRL
jgi:hypothetical protein